MSAAPTLHLIEPRGDLTALQAIGLAATDSLDDCAGADVAVIAYFGGWRRALDSAALLIGVARTVTVVGLDLSIGQDVRGWLGGTVDDPVLGRSARALVEAITVKHPLVVDEVDGRVLDHLRHVGPRTPTEVASGSLGGVGVRRRTVEGALARLEALGAVESRSEPRGRKNVARVFAATAEAAGQAWTTVLGEGV